MRQREQSNTSGNRQQRVAAASHPSGGAAGTGDRHRPPMAGRPAAAPASRSATAATAAPATLSTHAADGAQYSLRTILLLWAAASLPMTTLAWVVWPLVRDEVSWHHGITFWLLMIVGMIWQCLLSLIVLYRELGTLRWSAVAPRIWANQPRDPATGQPNRRLWWWILPAILVVGLVADALAGVLDAPMGWLGLHAPANTNVQDLATEAFIGAWWLLPIAMVSSIFNYVLGEELFWRGVLLPKMRGAFGRWDWLANTVLFTVYHLHKVWTWPSGFIGNLLIVYPARRFRSNWMAVVIHGIEGVVLLVMVTLVILGIGV